jgi:membrane-bound inhibitor of C-type lysozyme
MKAALLGLFGIGVLGAVTAGTAQPAATERRVTYTCENGPDMTVTYGEGVARVERARDEPVTLNQQPTGSGTLYQSETHRLSGRGDEIRYRIGSSTPIRCRAGAIPR